MTSTKAAVRIRVKLADGKFRFCKPVAVANGRFKPLYALVNGVPAHHPEGVYYLRYTDRGKRVWETIGRDHNLVNVAQKRRENILMSRQLEIQVVGDSSGSESSRGIIQSAVGEYIAEIKASSRANGTAQHYENTLRLFVESLVDLNPLRPATKRVLEDLDRRDILHFMSFLKEHRNAPRTVFNRVGYLNTFLRHHGIIGLLPKKDMPKFTEKLVAAYTEDEIRALLAVASPEDGLLFLFFLWSGAREQEVTYCSWSDISFAACTFSVTEKPDLGFKPKDHEERTVPLPSELVEELKEYRRQCPDARLLFTNSKGGPDTHFLRRVKSAALRANLNCGHSHNKNGLCCKTHPVCRHFELDKFRKTFAFFHHEHGVSARTLMAWLGHSDLSTTLKYLQVSDVRSERTRSLVDNSYRQFASAANL
jgi:integrase